MSLRIRKEREDDEIIFSIINKDNNNSTYKLLCFCYSNLNIRGMLCKTTLLGKIMACFIMTGKIMGGENMAKLVKNRQIFQTTIVPVTSASQNIS